MFRAIFLDRDGVLIENQPEYVRDWSHVKVFHKAIEALSGFAITNYKIVIATNQSAVGRNLISLETAQGINNRIVKIIEESGGRVDGVYMCPHAPEDQCSCRKPQPGLLLQAAKELSLNLHESWMIGDAWSDLMAGHTAGLRGVIMVKTGRGTEQLLQPQPENINRYFIVNDLVNAFDTIREIDQGLSR